MPASTDGKRGRSPVSSWGRKRSKSHSRSRSGARSRSADDGRGQRKPAVLRRRSSSSSSRSRSPPRQRRRSRSDSLSPRRSVSPGARPARQRSASPTQRRLRSPSSSRSRSPAVRRSPGRRAPRTSRSPARKRWVSRSVSPTARRRARQVLAPQRQPQRSRSRSRSRARLVRTEQPREVRSRSSGVALNVPEWAHRLFRDACVQLVRRGKLPCNVSNINDVMRLMDRRWHHASVGAASFTQLVLWFEARHDIQLSRDGRAGSSYTLTSTAWAKSLKPDPEAVAADAARRDARVLREMGRAAPARSQHAQARRWHDDDDRWELRPDELPDIEEDRWQPEA